REVRSLGGGGGGQKRGGVEKGEGVAVARFEEIGAVAIMRLLRDLLARGLVGPVLGDKAEKVARDLGARALAQRPQRRARPLAIALRQQRQGEQPLAGVVDGSERQAPRALRVPASGVCR